MKTITSLLLILLLQACATPKRIPYFKKENVCSDESLSYLSKTSVNNLGKVEAEKFQRVFRSIAPKISDCYSEEMNRTKKVEAFNLCQVINYDKKGKLNFAEFSTKEVTLSTELKSCLEKINQSIEISGVKDTSVFQRYSLYPKGFAKDYQPVDAFKPGTYEGKLPCADCEGVLTTLQIASASKASLHLSYIGKDKKSVSFEGYVSSTSEKEFTFFGYNSGNECFKVLNNDELLQLDKDCKEITNTKLNYKLLRKD